MRGGRILKEKERWMCTQRRSDDLFRFQERVMTCSGSQIKLLGVREIGKEVSTYVKSFGLGVVDAPTFRGGSDDAGGRTCSNVHPKKE